MADAEPIPPSKAEFLADWTKLDDGRFGDCYVTVHQPGKAPDWETIVALPGGPLKLRACQAAADGRFLDNLARAVANWEHKASRPNAEIATMIDRVCSYGVMQGMNNQQKGFMNADILLPMIRASEACAIVMREKPVEEQLGTAFLVGPDLVLTAAHVVMAAQGDAGAGQWLDRLQDDLVFEFRARPNQPPQNRVPIRAAKDKPLVAWASPHGAPPNLLDRSLDPPADSRLDFALVRLAQRVEHVQPVELVDDASVSQGKACWAFGYAGGDILMMDVDLVTAIREPAGRWLHTANTTGGMSGGCCLNHQGQIAGIHEGTLEPAEAGTTSSQNRGVSIAAIRRAQLSSGKDPLRAAPRTPSLEFQDPRLVEGLYRAGRRLGGDAMAEPWRKQVQAALGGIDPEGSPAWPPYHPWFPRSELESWIDKGDERLCLVYGRRGAGTSFCARILREKLDPLATDLLDLSPTQLTGMNWGDALSKVLATPDPAYRTAAAAVRYNDIGAVLEELRRGSADRSRRCYVVLDFGSSGDSSRRFVGTQWLELVAALVALSWTKVLLIGLDESERVAIIQRLNRPETSTVSVAELEMEPISRNAFLNHARLLVKARASDMSETELRDRFKELLPADLFDNEALQDLQTVVTALAGIVLETELR